MVDVNQTFAGTELAQNLLGIYTPLTSSVLGGTLTLNGSFNAVGDHVSATSSTLFGLTGTSPTQAVYEGYYNTAGPNGTTVANYVFQVGTGLGTTEFSVNPNGSALLTAFPTLITTGPIPVDSGLAPTPCFASGTLIRTTRGDVAVEDLAMGDMVLTLGGDIKPVTWIGSRQDKVSNYAPEHRVDFWPILFKAGSLGANRPERDLYVSPLHGMFIDGVRVAAWRLLNHNTISHATDVVEVEYFHVELSEHSILFANGAAAESFFEFDNFHNAFDNASTYTVSQDSAEAVRFGREVGEGEELNKIRAKLALLADAQAETAAVVG